MTTTITLTVEEVAEQLRSSRRAVYDLISAGALATVDITSGGRPRLRVTRTALEEFVASRTTERPARVPS